ncbi:MAG: CDP-alcohol phosphatidyltransferase family protein [Clostridia bacterium]
MRHIPNILSAIRILMIGVFIYFFVNVNYVACLITYIIAFLTDLLDGYLARRNNWISDLGKVLDPLADKLMLITALVCFTVAGWVPLWLLILVVSKELLMILGGMFLYKKKIVVYADWFGKTAAGLFNGGVVLTLLAGFFPFLYPYNIVVLVIALGSAIVALFHYAKMNGIIKGKE